MATISIYPPPGDQRVRFLLADGAAYRTIAWMKILPDGSLVFSPATGKGGASFAKAGMAEPTERGPRVSYAGGEVVTDPRERRELHVTYHASGIVNAGTRRSFAAPLRELDGPIQLFQAVFRHPSAAPEVVEPRKCDALLLEEPGTAFAVDDERPLVGRVLAGPQGQLQVSTDRYSTTLVMPFRGAEDCPPLDFGFEFAHASPGPWPPYSYVVWAAERND